MRTLLAYICLVLTLGATAQLGRKELSTDSGLVVLHHFRNGMVSTREWRDKDDRWGLSCAYDRNGKEIFTYRTRRFAGHASAHFSYHPNGAISRVDVSDAPDGGIQWYRSTTTFDEAGNRTGFSEQGHDNYGPIPGPGTVRITRPTITPEKPPPSQEVIACQRLFVNEVLVVNRTPSACRVMARPLAPSPAMPAATYTLAPGDTVRLGTYSIGEAFATPERHVDLGYQEVKLDGTGSRQALTDTMTVAKGPEHRVHVIRITGWGQGDRRKEGPRSQPSLQDPGPSIKRWWKFWQ